MPDGVVGVLIEPQQVAHYPTVQQGAVRIGVGQVCRLEVQFTEVVEDGLGRGQLVIGKGVEIQDGEGFGTTDAYISPACDLNV